MSPPEDKLEKVAMVLDRAMRYPKTLRFRQFYARKPSSDEFDEQYLSTQCKGGDYICISSVLSFTRCATHRKLVGAAERKPTADERSISGANSHRMLFGLLRVDLRDFFCVSPS